MDWNAIADPWLRVETETDAAHAPIRAALMTRANLKSGQLVLDIGPGAGISLIDAARAVAPAGRVTGIEIAPPFVARAKERVPAHVEVLTGDAAEYPFEENRFDAALSLLGVMFFSDPDAAFGHLRRACKPGAPLTFACWGPREDNPWFNMPGHVAARVLGPAPPTDPEAPGPMALADRDRIARVLERAGWNVEIDTIDLHLTPIGRAEDVAQMHMTIGAAASRMGIAKADGALTDAHRSEISTGLIEGFMTFQHDGTVKVPARVHIVRALA